MSTKVDTRQFQRLQKEAKETVMKNKVEREMLLSCDKWQGTLERIRLEDKEAGMKQH